MNYESDDIIQKYLDDNKERMADEGDEYWAITMKQDRLTQIAEEERKRYPHYEHDYPGAIETALVVLFVAASVTIVITGVVMLLKWIF